MVWKLLTPLSYGCPQSRPRFYIIGWRISDDAIDQRTEQFAPPPVTRRWEPCLRAFQNADATPIDEFLLAADHKHVQSWLHERERNLGKDDPKRSKGDYEVTHYEVFRKHGLLWPPAYNTDTALAKCTAHLPRRQREVAWFHSILATAVGLTRELVIDLNMNPEWAQDDVHRFCDTPGQTPSCCIVSTAGCAYVDANYVAMRR